MSLSNPSVHVAYCDDADRLAAATEIAIDDWSAVVQHRHVATWIDVAVGAPTEAALDRVSSAFAALADLNDLNGLDLGRAFRAPTDPLTTPPKSKAADDFIFSRMYWTQPVVEGHIIENGPARRMSIIWNEIRLIATRDLVITVRCAGDSWDRDAWGAGSTTLHETGPSRPDDRLLTELERRFGNIPAASAGSFGLTFAEQLIDAVSDAAYSDLDQVHLQLRLEEDFVLGHREWAWHPDQRATVDRHLVGLRRLLRNLRLVVLPDDEIHELQGTLGATVTASDRLSDLAAESRRYQTTIEHLFEHAADVVSLRDTVENDRHSAITYVLTVVATVLLVPALVAGIYGMNVIELPFSNTHYWFWGIVGLMLLLGTSVWLVIRWQIKRLTTHATGRSRP